MTTTAPPAETLPVLRPDIEFHRGPDDEAGAPTYVIHDPLRGTFEHATWVQAEVLRRLRVPLSLQRLMRHLHESTTIRVTPEDVRALCDDAAARGLTLGRPVIDEGAWRAAREKTRPVGLTSVFRRLVFLRVPLLRPDRFLDRTVRYVRWLGSRPALVAYFMIALIGVLALSQRLDAYVATFPYFFNAAGVAAFVGVIAAIKVIHEFSHAYVAKAMGNRVPSMGVALIFLFPVAFADVTDSWRMRDRHTRLLISLAGVLAELVIAGIALIGWTLTPPGLLNSLCFVVSSVTLLSTLLVNLNPAMRFDGYYVLSDLLGIDNLQPRAFAHARWAWRYHVLGMPLAAPEPELARRPRGVLLGYAVGASLYRLLVYTGIAFMLYHRVTKVLGAVLLVLALYTFLVRPVARELLEVWRMRRHWRFTWRSAGLAAVLLGLATWAAWPLPRRVALPATTVAAATQVVYAPGAGVVQELDVGPDEHVRVGQVLLVVASRELEEQRRRAELDVRRVQAELALLRGDEQRRALLPQKTEELVRARARLAALQEAVGGLCVRAEVSGVVAAWDEAVRPGVHIRADQVLGRIVSRQTPRVTGYVRDDLAATLQVGTPVRFVPDAEPAPLAGAVTFVDPVRTRVLPHRGLASVAGGDIAVAPDGQGRLEMVDAYYAVEVALSAPAALRTGQTGRLWLRTAPRSYVAEWLCWGQRVLVRESSF